MLTILSVETMHGPFVIDPTSGVLTTSMTLDYETRTSYTFMAVCANSSDESDSATTTVRIQILPVNEYRPMIHENSISQDVNESIPVNTIIISTDNNGIKEFTVTDQDASPDGIVTFSFRNLTSSPNVPHFSLNRTSGALVVSQNLDVDTLNGVTDTIRFEIIACDEDPPVPECPRLNVSISITATNDNSPQFSQDITLPRIFPDTTTEVGTVLLTAICTDADRGVGEFASIIFDSVTPGNRQIWNLDTQTGALTLAQSLDYDTARTYRLNLRCIDTGSPPRSATATITIDVERNEPPVFATDRYNVTFSQEAEVGSVIAQVSCSDNKKQVASYEIFNPSAEVNETFRVNNNGELTLIGSLDVCEQSRYELTILCLDGVDQTASATVEIDVDHGRIYFENCNYTFEFDCFTMLNNKIGQVTARSSEGGDPQYTFVEDNQFFSIDNNGRILLANYILLIQDSTFTFEVEASIGSGVEQMNDIATVTINVRGPLSVLDVIIIAAAGYTTNGTVVLNMSLDYETAQMHEFILRCFDTGGREGFATVTVNVLPVNDAKPVFSQPSYAFTVSRINTPSNDLAIGNVTAIDCDLSGKITYSLEDNENFRITNDGRILLVDYILVLEGNSFNLTVTAHDGEFNATSLVYITVTGLLSIPEIVLVGLAGLILLVLVAIIGCCVMYCCFEQKSR